MLLSERNLSPEGEFNEREVAFDVLFLRRLLEDLGLRTQSGHVCILS